MLQWGRVGEHYTVVKGRRNQSTRLPASSRQPFWPSPFHRWIVKTLAFPHHHNQFAKLGFVWHDVCIDRYDMNLRGRGTMVLARQGGYKPLVSPDSRLKPVSIIIWIQMMRFMPHNERALDSASFSLSLYVSGLQLFVAVPKGAHGRAQRGHFQEPVWEAGSNKHVQHCQQWHWVLHVFAGSCWTCLVVKVFSFLLKFQLPTCCALRQHKCSFQKR